VHITFAERGGGDRVVEVLKDNYGRPPADPLKSDLSLRLDRIAARVGAVDDLRAERNHQMRQLRQQALILWCHVTTRDMGTAAEGSIELHNGRRVVFAQYFRSAAAISG